MRKFSIIKYFYILYGNIMVFIIDTIVPIYYNINNLIWKGWKCDDAVRNEKAEKGTWTYK